MGCSNDLTCRSNKHWRLKQAREDHCGINTSVLRSMITKLPITQTLAVSQAEFFMDALVTRSWIYNGEFAYWKHPFPLWKSHQTPLIYTDVRWKAMQAYIICRARYNKTAHASKLKEAESAYVLQPKAGHQGRKTFFTEIRWIGP